MKKKNIWKSDLFFNFEYLFQDCIIANHKLSKYLAINNNIHES
jgi:hypothetical protein